MALTGLKEDALKLILFGGKGGVGKTTCALSAGKVYPAGLKSRDCRFCRKRSDARKEYIKRIRIKFRDLKPVIMPLQPREVKGIEGVK